MKIPNIRAIAFYLPQFHPTPENDTWWGAGFTEWRNVTKAAPLFPGHHQPKLPADLGFYDLRLPEVREAQAALARQYGVHGFCYYHYWFNGRRILERPFNDVLASGEPDLPFCLCWANENWTRAWDGGEKEILLGQEHSVNDDIAHIRSLVPAFLDPRYIRIDGKPLFLVYRTEELPDAARTAAIWREEARRLGVGELYLARVESFAGTVDPSGIGFDAAVEFAPDWRTVKPTFFRSRLFELACRLGWLPKTYSNQMFTSYDILIERMLNKPVPTWKRFRCATPGFDNSSRRPETGAVVFVGSTPGKFENWLSTLGADAANNPNPSERIVFINAWNEWAEGNYLEPDRRFGHAYLEATRRALSILDAKSAAPHQLDTGSPASRPEAANFFRRSGRYLLRRWRDIGDVVWHIQYWRARRNIQE